MNLGNEFHKCLFISEGFRRLLKKASQQGRRRGKSRRRTRWGTLQDSCEPRTSWGPFSAAVKARR